MSPPPSRIGDARPRSLADEAGPGGVRGVLGRGPRAARVGCAAEDAEDAGEACAEDVSLSQVRAAEEGARLLGPRGGRVIRVPMFWLSLSLSLSSILSFNVVFY